MARTIDWVVRAICGERMVSVIVYGSKTKREAEITALRELGAYWAIDQSFRVNVEFVDES